MQVLHPDEHAITTDDERQAPLVGRESGPLRPPPRQRGRREAVRRSGRERLLVPVPENGHGQVRILNASTHEFDELW